MKRLKRLFKNGKKRSREPGGIPASERSPKRDRLEEQEDLSLHESEFSSASANLAAPMAFDASMIAAARKVERREPLAPEDRTSLQNLQSLLSRTINFRKKADADSSSKESGLEDLQEILLSERILYPAEIDYVRSLDQKITEALNQSSSEPQKQPKTQQELMREARLKRFGKQ